MIEHGHCGGHSKNEKNRWGILALRSKWTVSNFWVHSWARPVELGKSVADAFGVIPKWVEIFQCLKYPWEAGGRLLGSCFYQCLEFFYTTFSNRTGMNLSWMQLCMFGWVAEIHARKVGSCRGFRMDFFRIVNSRSRLSRSVRIRPQLFHGRYQYSTGHHVTRYAWKFLSNVARYLQG